ncbi:MAG: agmatinase [Candidatus Heimdallarchaeota archaeon]
MNSETVEAPFFRATTEALTDANMIVLGIPWDASSSYRKGAANAPTVIRQATSGKLYSPYTERIANIANRWQLFDYGNVAILSEDPIEARNEVLTTVQEINRPEQKNRFLFLGGDHLATYFSVIALQKVGILEGKTVGMVYLDAHPDLYTNYDGNRYSHACVLQRIIEETQIEPHKIVQVGIRAASPEQRDFIQQTGITSISRRTFHKKGAKEIGNQTKKALEGTDLIYLSIDLDVLDPACAPGLGNPEPGGLMTAEVVDFIQRLAGLPIFAFDIVELCPPYDHGNITAFAAAKLIRETLGIMK